MQYFIIFGFVLLIWAISGHLLYLVATKFGGWHVGLGQGASTTPVDSGRPNAWQVESLTVARYLDRQWFDGAISLEDYCRLRDLVDREFTLRGKPPPPRSNSKPRGARLPRGKRMKQIWSDSSRRARSSQMNRLKIWP